MAPTTPKATSPNVSGPNNDGDGGPAQTGPVGANTAKKAVSAIGISVPGLMFASLPHMRPRAALVCPLEPLLFPSPSQEHGANDAQSNQTQSANATWAGHCHRARPHRPHRHQYSEGGDQCCWKKCAKSHFPSLSVTRYLGRVALLCGLTEFYTQFSCHGGFEYSIQRLSQLGADALYRTVKDPDTHSHNGQSRISVISMCWAKMGPI